MAYAWPRPCLGQPYNSVNTFGLALGLIAMVTWAAVVIFSGKLVKTSELYIDWNDNSGGILKPNMGAAMQAAPVPFRKMASKKIG